MARNSDREEGEISCDENEIILRIKEYETTNRELEQIAQINNYSPYKRIKNNNLISELSSISSEELTIPIHSKKRRRTFKKKRKSKKQCNFRHISRNHEENNRFSEFVDRQQTIQFYERINAEYDSNSKNSVKVCEISDDSENESSNAVNREELRLALIHSFAKNEISRVTLKERLEKEKYSSTISSELNPKLPVCDKNEDFEDSLEEDELRMIALKSAILRKHLARKKRNAESAYSPTDFDATLASTNNIEENDVEEIPIYSMDTSPMSSPSSNMSLSMSASFADNKTVDMDIASSSSDIEMVIYENEKSDQCDLVNMVDSLNSVLHDYDPLDQSSQGQHSAPPPPPYILSNIDAFCCENTNNILVNCHNTQISNTPQIVNLQSKLNLPGIEVDVNEHKSVLKDQSCLNEIDSDLGNNVEEEEALRALLLSKLSTSTLRKSNIKKKEISLQSEELKLQHNYDSKTICPDSNFDENEKCTLDNDNDDVSKCQNPEMILKKAVLRLNNISTFENSLNSDIENTRCNGQLQSALNTDLNSVYNNGQNSNNVKTEQNNNRKKIIQEVNKPRLKASSMKNKTRSKILRKIKENEQQINLKHVDKIVTKEMESIIPIEAENLNVSTDSNLDNHKSANEYYENPSKITGVSRSKSVDEIKYLSHNTDEVSKTDSSASLLSINNVTNFTSSNKTTEQILTKPSASNPPSPVPISIKTSVNTNSSRLITAVNLPDLKVKKLVIRVNVSDSEDDVNCLTSMSASNSKAERKSDESNKNFEHHIDTFLRNIRLNTSNNSDDNVIKPISRKEENSVNFMTPQAVKHLPKPAQEEYLRLVNRMNLLQKKKQLKITKTVNDHENQDNCTKPNKVLIKEPTKEAVTEQSENTLKGYESLLRKISVHIISRLDKSLKLVEEAKNVKIEKLKSEQRLKKLRAELELEQQRFRLEQQKMQSLSPTITVANDEITSLKQKRLRLVRFSNNLGKSVRGTEYRSANEFKHEISLKSKQLASSIKVVNSIKLKNLEEFDTTRTPISSVDGDILRNPESTMQLQEIQCEPNVQEIFNEANNEKDDLGCAVAASIAHNVNEESCEENAQDIRHTRMACVVETQSLQEYISPLSHTKSKRNLNGIVCPYELMGECKDNDCIYVHLDSGDPMPP